MRAAKRREYVALRARVHEALGHVCARCGFNDKRALQFDHLLGGGRAHHLASAGMTAYRDMIREPEKYQVLCANCNWIKKSEQDENPNRGKM